MKIVVNNNVSQHLPGFRMAGIVCQEIQNERRTSAIEQLLRGACAQKKSQLKDPAKSKPLRDQIEQAKIDKQTLPEVQLLESDLKKIERRKNIDVKNNLHTLVHYFGLKYGVPIHGRDLDEEEKDIVIDFIQLQKGKKAQDVEVTNETKNVVLWLTDIGTVSHEEFEQLHQELAILLQKYCQGTISLTFGLNADQPEDDLQYVSEKERNYQPDHIDEVMEVKVLEMEKMEEEKKAAKKESPLMNERIKKLLKESIEGVDEIQVETPNDPTHGDYSTNIALQEAKKQGKNPREFAENLIKTIKKPNYIEKIDIAGPGFINFHLATDHLEKELDQVIDQAENYGRMPAREDKKVLVEYSQPNIAKPLGVHHLLSTIIGQTIADLYRAAGYNTISLNYLGDWGTQFGKLLYAYKTWGDEEVVKKDPLNELLKLYVKFHEEEEKDEALTDKGRAEFKKLEEGDEENTKLLEWIRQLSIDEINRIYDILDVKFDEVLGEKQYLEASKKILEMGKESGVFTEGEKGALIVDFGEKLPPYMVQKADGTTLYSTRDLASIQDRIARYNPQKILYVVDVAQKLHFEQLFPTAEKLGLLQEDGPQLAHIIFGRMQLPEGRMSTRKGTVILLDEVIKEAVERAGKIVEEKGQDLSTEEKEIVARGMAIGAIKYNVISQNRETDMNFDWDRMLSLDGNSGPYLQYAYARARSIERKASEASSSQALEKIQTETHEDVIDADPPPLEGQVSLFGGEPHKEENPSPSAEPAESEDAPTSSESADVKPFADERELAVMRLIQHFDETIVKAAEENKPNILTNYLFELAKAFNSFYNSVPVLTAGNSETLKARLKLVKAAAQVIKNGLSILGIQTFEKM